jgi:hypothetical protein
LGKSQLSFGCWESMDGQTPSILPDLLLSLFSSLQRENTPFPRLKGQAHGALSFSSTQRE